MTPNDLRQAEAEVAQLWNDGEISAMCHLGGGNEQWLCDFFHANIKLADWVFASHRSHFHYLLHGGVNLAEKVKNGKSMFLYGPRFICSAIVAGTASIAAGLAASIMRRGGSERVWCFVGDGASEEGNFYEAVRWADGVGLPVTFVIEDNDSSCGVTKAKRGIRPFPWPACVIVHPYTLTWPHTGTGVRPKLK